MTWHGATGKLGGLQHLYTGVRDLLATTRKSHTHSYTEDAAIQVILEYTWSAPLEHVVCKEVEIKPPMSYLCSPTSRWDTGATSWDTSYTILHINFNRLTQLVC